jgi:tetratricopeptide (TPR) repeat protein
MRKYGVEACRGAANFRSTGAAQAPMTHAGRGKSVRRSCACLLALCSLLFAAAPAAGQAGRRVLVGEPLVDAELESLGPGYALWLARRLSAAGIDTDAAPPGLSDSAAVVAEALSRGSAYALLPSLHLREGVVRVQLRLVAPEAEALVAAAHADAPLALVGDACERSAWQILANLGAEGGRPAQAPAPLLDGLATSGRALRWIDQGELERAWREVEGKLSPTATSLRSAIVEAARRSDTPLAQRARVLAASGDERSAWSLIAEEVSRQGEAARPDRAILLAAADVQLARNDPRGARAHLDRLVATEPADAEVQLRLGSALRMQRNEDGARRAFELAAELTPADPRPWLELADLDAARPERRARALLAAGEREARLWDLHRAERLFEEALALDAGAAVAVFQARARMHQDVGREAEALEAWNQALAAGADDADSWTGVGRARRALEQPDAQEAFERALALDPRHPETLSRLGRMQVDVGRPELAIPLLREAVAVRPADAGARLGLARALRATGEPREALALLVGPEAPTGGGAERLRVAASIQREQGDLAAARESLERAVELEPSHAPAHAELAEVYAELGDEAGAAGLRRLAAVLEGGGEPPAAGDTSPRAGPNLDDLALAFAGQVARAHERRVAHLGLREPWHWRVQLLRWLHPREPDLALLTRSFERALALRFGLVTAEPPDSPLYREAVDALYAFDERASRDARSIADVNTLLDTDAVFVTRLTSLHPAPEDAAGEPPRSQSCADPARFELEVRMLSGRHPDVVSILTDVECLPGGLAAHGAWNRRALAVYGAAALLFVFPLLRGWGSLVVEIKLPPRTRGFLRIRIARRPQEVKDDRAAGRRRRDGRLRRSLASFSRYQKHMAGRETRFRWLPARRRHYFVTVRGPLYDALGNHEIGHFMEEQRVRIARGATERLVYDFNPSEVAVQVTVLWNGEPAANARVALRADPRSLRYARNGTVFLHCGKGTHTVCAGVRDRAAERAVEIGSLDSAVPVSIDLGREEGLLVRNAPEAVEPYLVGDFETASRALEAAGEQQLAHLMRGAHHQQRGELERAAAEFEAAGCIAEAAELRSSGSDHEGSAALFEQAGDHARAGDAYRASGALAEAARCYEAAYDYDAAIECYEASGNLDKVIELHEKSGAYLDAALLAQRNGDLDRALHNVQQVERRDPSYGEACRLAAEILAHRGDFELAADKLGEAVALAGGEAAPAELHELHARLLERGDDKRRALEAYQALRRRDPGRHDVTEHIDALRRELEGGEPPTRMAPAAGRAASAPAAESRYEVLGELGRGGMGVVLKARDRRLDRIVALKRLPDNLRDNQVAAQLFLREARAAAALNHQNIVTVYDADEENGVYHITMELLEGLPLNVIQERRGAIGARDAARLLGQVCAGLQYAHERRIVHRDIKPANLFFTREKVVKIMDFGLAKTIEEVRKSSTVIGGTPYYMAPEQAAGEAVGPATDLYALGITLYRLLTGSFPFADGDLAYHHRHTAPPDPREHCAGLDPALAALVLELLAKDPAARPASAADVAARLRPFAQRPPS